MNPRKDDGPNSNNSTRGCRAYNSLLAEASKVDLATDAALKSESERINILHTAVWSHQRRQWDTAYIALPKHQILLRWVLRPHTKSVL